MSGIDDELRHSLFALEPDAVGCPYPLYDQLRTEAPVAWMPEIEAFAVTRYSDVVDVLRQPDRFSSAMATGPVQVRQTLDAIGRLRDSGGAAFEQVLNRANRGRTPVLLSADPPRHAQQRSIVNRAFTPRRVKESEPAVRAIANRIVDGFVEEGRVELVRGFAVPLPLAVIADRLGVPREDVADFKRWSDDFTVAIGNHRLGDEQLRAMLVSQAEFFEYFTTLIGHRREHPTDDILSVVANAELEDGEALTMPELLGILSQFLVAGNETTTKLLASAVLRLVADPSLVAALRARKANIEPFVEEVLRLDAPVQGLYRIANADEMVGGVKIPKGSALWLVWASANRDEAVFRCPGELNLERDNLRQHLSFGFGEHYCIGAALARLEGRVGIEVLLDRLDDLALTGSEVLHEPSYVLHGIKQLHLAFTARRQDGAASLGEP